MATARLLFFPWLRQGFAARLAQPDTGAPGLPASVNLKVSLAVTGSAATDPGVDVRVRGPADVIGIDPRQVLRTEPPDGSTDFEALDLAAIEFDNPDLPWLFTPAAADAQGRLRPWIALVVVRVQDGVRLRPAGSEPLPVLEIGAPARVAEELPDLAQSWAWAHAQLSWTGDAPPSPTALEQLVATRPELSVARLLSPRRLEAHTEYLACVVPTFEVGRRAGLNLPPPASATLAPAWPNAEDPSRIALPVYHHWQFRTGAREDFETIVDRLVPRDLSELVGRRPLDIGRPGFAYAATPGRDGLIALEGALQPVGMARMALADAAGPGWQAALQALLNTSLGADDDDPLVGPPVYGRWLAGRRQVGSTLPPTWLDEINLDPRERVAAGLGTRVVQAQQDELVAQAWAQAGEMAAVNQRLRQLQLAGAVGTRLLQRHVRPFTQGAAGQDDMLWRLAAPARAQLRLPDPQDPAPGATASMRALIARTNASDATLSAPLRRLTRPRGALARRSARVARKLDVAAPPVVATGRLFQVFFTASVIFRPVPEARGCVTVDDVSRRAPAPNPSLLYAGMTDAAVAGAPRRPGFVVAPEPPALLVATPATVVTRGAPAPARLIPIFPPGEGPPPIDPDPDPPPPVEPPAPPPVPVDSADAARFRAAARRHLALVNPAPAPTPVLTLLALEPLLVAQRPSVQAQLDPAPMLAQRWRAAVQRAEPAPSPAAATLPGGALGLIPRYTLPASEALARLSQDWLLPGLQQVPADTVALLEPNRRFIEAFMLGLNVEMTRELVWRDFPLAHETGTYFERFWRSARATVPGDIVPLAGWGTARLGEQAPREVTGAPMPPPLVLLLRSVLLRRYPGTAVYAVRGVAQGAQRRPPEGAGEERLPLFRGALEPDIAFFGFDIPVAEAIGHPGWYFVLQQQPTEPRFGVDAPPATGAGSHLRLDLNPDGSPRPAATPWAVHAGQAARALLQLPVRVLIHASELLPA
ncbi:hypothetical protein [Piscinibacter defluvii]|uniref:hypothetical protein n=1 Tax=Piscinibacter defluvii TaxID=1796922 RepID=UPI000FDEEF7D|nr:hypothetical protein [Piscinibacter defluvii]